MVLYRFDKFNGKSEIEVDFENTKCKAFKDNGRFSLEKVKEEFDMTDLVVYALYDKPKPDWETAESFALLVANSYKKYWSADERRDTFLIHSDACLVYNNIGTPELFPGRFHGKPEKWFQEKFNTFV